MSYLFGGTPFDGYDAGGRRALNSGGGSSAPSAPTEQKVTQSNIPDWLQDPTQRMVARGETLSEQPYQAYTGQRIAEFAPAQEAAFQQIYGLQTPAQYAQAGQSIGAAQEFGAAGALQAMGYQPSQFAQYQMSGPQNIRASNVYGTGYNAVGAQAAPDITGTAYDAAQAQYAQGWTPQAAAQYMSPYQQAVTDIAKREATSEAQMLNRELGSKAAKAGAFGGSRFGIEQALLGSKLATNLSDIQTKGSEAAYLSGLGQFNTEQQARQAVNLANQAALNQAGQFGASQSQAANLANQQMRQQANMASQQAYNEALRFGATQDQAAQVANQTARLTASQANQQMQYQTGVQNLQSALTVQQQQEAARQAGAGINLQGAQFGAQTGLQAGTQLANLGTAQQQADLNRIQALAAAGEQQQSMEQQKLSAAYQDYLEQRDWEKNQLGFMSGLIRGTPFSTSQTTTGYQSAPSGTSQLLSGALGVAGLASLLKKEGGKIDKAEGLSKKDKRKMLGQGLAEMNVYKMTGGK